MSARISNEQLSSLVKFAKALHTPLHESAFRELQASRALVAELRALAERMDEASKNSNSTRADYFVDHWASEIRSLILPCRKDGEVLRLRDSAADLINAAATADWGQVAMNGGPPCFHLDGARFCLRSQRWAGHDADGSMHRYISLAELLTAQGDGE